MQLKQAVEPLDSEAGYLASMLMQIYENIGHADLDTLRALYARDVCFEDPVHAIQGLEAMLEYFRRQFANVHSCRFRFHQQSVTDTSLFLTWTMLLQHKKMKRGHTIRVEGASYLKIRDGKIYFHRDYFDLGDMVYENLPLLGGMIGFIRRRMAQ